VRKLSQRNRSEDRRDRAFLGKIIPSRRSASTRLVDAPALSL